MLMRARWLGAAVVASIAVSLAAAPFVAGGCQSTCATADDCGKSSYCSTATGVCLSAQAVGFCKDVPSTCPDVVSPVCGCNGKQYQNQCFAEKDRVAVASTGACSTSCGGAAALTCSGTSTYCHFQDGVCGVGNASGTCDPVPSSCEGATPGTVCGCDGKTYASRCEAQAAGTSVASTGACACGGISGTKCEAGKFCQLPVGSCTQPNPSGTCVEIPSGACSTFSSPVCGCDGKTYTNACEAVKAQVNVGTTGLCPCGGLGGVTCGADEFCSYPMVGNCLTPGNLGSCEPRPTQCTGVMSPVCGCDGKTYQNPCEAAKAGTAVALSTACP